MFPLAETSAELSLPPGADLAPVRRALRALRGAVNTVGLTDNHMSRARLSPLAAVADCRAMGLRAIVHLSCRDRNLLGLQQQVAGAVALGAEGILVVRGDRSAPVQDSGVRVAEVLRELPRWGHPKQVLRGAALNPFADRRRELALLERKVRAGIDFVQTQMVFDVGALDRFLEEARSVMPSETVVFASVGVVRSRRSLEFIRASIPDCPIPEPLAERIGRRQGVQVAAELAAQIGERPGLRLHVISLGAEHHVPEIADAFRQSRTQEFGQASVG